MHYLGWAIFGLVAGAIARLLHPGRDPMNWLWTMLLGIAGAFVGGWIVENTMGVERPGRNHVLGRRDRRGDPAPRRLSPA